MRLLLLLLFTTGTFCWASEHQAGGWEDSELGETAIFKMKNAPYPHSSRKEGYQTENKTFPLDPHYVDNSVALFIPKGFKLGKKTDLLFYFHGHYSSIEEGFEKYKVREQVVASGMNVILVFPEGPKYAIDSGSGKLEESGGLQRLTEEVLNQLYSDGKIKSTQLGKVILSGHSGGYRVISYCLEKGGLEKHISEVYLLDASYDRLEQYIDWATRNPQGRLTSIFTDHLTDENVFIMTHLTRQGQRYKLLNDEDVTTRILLHNRLLFLHTTRLRHLETVRFLEIFLMTSDLEKR